MTEAVRALVELVREEVCYEAHMNQGACPCLRCRAKRAIAAVEAESSHTETVEIPQGETCDCPLTQDEHQCCQNPEAPAELRKAMVCLHGRPQWCRDRYGYTGKE